MRAFATHVADAQPDVVILERSRLRFFRECVPSPTAVFLDVHDLVSDGQASRAALNIPIEQPITLAEEVRAFEPFDRVLLIQPYDHARVGRLLKSGQALLMSHPSRLARQTIRERMRIVGFIGSAYYPNVDAMRWFLRRVWSRFQAPHVALHVYGFVGPKIAEFVGELPAGPRARVEVHGATAALQAAYDTIDVVINPVRVGSGLKIKTVEALMSGLPLLTTTEGVRGLSDGIGDAFLVADGADDFGRTLTRLGNSTDLRRSLGAAAHEYARTRFTPEVCFGPVLRAIEEVSQ